MAKKSQGSRAVPVATGFVQMRLKLSLPDAVWEVELDEPLYIVTGEPEELLELPAGTKLYFEPGGLAAWRRVGKAEESDAWPRLPTLEQSGEDLHYEPNGAEEEIPF